MRILHINGTSYGGAANFVFDLHEEFLKKNVSSFVYSPKRRNINNALYPKSIFFKLHNLIKIILNKIINKIFIKSNNTITLSLFNSFEISKIIKETKPDLVNIHWLGNEFMSLKEVQSIKVPIVWTLHDMWIFQPFLHYTSERYKINSKQFFSNYLLQRKKKLRKKNINFISTSDWMLQQIEDSNLFYKHQLKKISCGVNFEIWKPEDKQNCKKLFNLDNNKKIILYMSIGGNNIRKGLNLLIDSLQFVKNDFQLVIVGDQYPTNIPKQLNYKFIDSPKDVYTRRSLYNAADLLAAPSILEAFGLVALEASACNLPSVIFNKTGLTEVIKHKENGYVSEFSNIKDYARGIDWIFDELSENPKRFENIKNQVKNKFDIKYISNMYLDIYKNLINDKKK
tara:strand:+ start:1991 stop:3181 length:1191 start_codon:yes stop_codon:yes gene_type:complete